MLNKCDVRIGYHFPFNCIHEYGTDQSGENEYKFNSLGFRGDEYSPDSKKNIFISGCSYTLGVGLDLEETWGSQFKSLLAKNLKLDSNDIGLMNFAVGGGSNDYITRILLSQSQIIKPDLIVAYFTHSSRTEFIEGNNIKMIGPWSIKEEYSEKNDVLNLDDAAEEALYYYSYTTPELEFVNMVKNMLLLQTYCKSHNINLLISSVYKPEIFDSKLKSQSVCTQYADLLDKKLICDFNLEQIDSASDGSHPGPASNIMFAKKLYETYKDLII